MNNVSLIGRLVKDVDMRYTANGVAVSNFTLACNRPFTNQQGEREADFIRIQVWRKQAENVANYCKKGSQVGVTGRIQTSSFDGDDGKKVFVTDIVADSVQFLDTRNGNQNGNQNGNANQKNPYQNQGQKQGNPYQNRSKQQQGNQTNDPFNNQSGPIDISDDDLPF